MKEGNRRMKGGDRGRWKEGTEEDEGRGQRRMEGGDRGG